jgi:hypothetical protein
MTQAMTCGASSDENLSSFDGGEIDFDLVLLEMA